MCVQNIQLDYSLSKMKQETQSYLDDLVTSPSKNKLAGIIINPNFATSIEERNLVGIHFIEKIIRGKKNTSRYKSFFAQTPTLYYCDSSFDEIQNRKTAGYVPNDFLLQDITKLNKNEKPTLNSYMYIPNRSQESLQKWLEFIQNL